VPAQPLPCRVPIPVSLPPQTHTSVLHTHTQLAHLPPCLSTLTQPQIPMSAVGRMFLRSPSLLNKRPDTLAAKAAALRGLPGLQQGQAAAMMAAMPSLLNLDPSRVASRWQRLQQVRQGQGWGQG
jgi:hypothetical protein